MRVPVSTYRLQFNSSFGFNDAKSILDYLLDLGITDIYASPVFRAVTGSTHGYDIVDHTSLNPELGTDSEFSELQARRERLGMGWIQDIVPNHMAFHSENLLLRDVLEKGKESRFRDFFDIEWNHAHESLRGRLLVPFLGRFYSESLENGEIKLAYEETGLYAQYYEHKFPLSLVSYPEVFGADEISAMNNHGINRQSILKLQGTLHQFTLLPGSPGDEKDYDRTSHAKKILRELYLSDPSIREFMEDRLTLYNSRESASAVERIDSVLEKQYYRLSLWKVAAEEINYRRFFNINGLISLRIEEEYVFNHIHRLIKELAVKGNITGIRVDHVDGLSDPAKYLRMLRETCGDLYILVEKIINSSELLPAEWPIQGTTGYDFINNINWIFCMTENEKEFSRIYFKFTERKYKIDEFIAEKKRLIIEKHMTGDIDNLAHLLKQISGNDRYGRDITMASLRNALIEVIAFFPVYRTYIESAELSSPDRGYIKASLEKARLCTPEYSFEYDFLEKCLTLEYIERMDEEKKARLLKFIMRFQQYTGPFMAKGFEDTVLYIVNRLISLNEVGGDPAKFGNRLNEFHNFINCRFDSHRYSMNATSTHDTKRGEDVRCRINVLSEIPGEWKNAVSIWSRINHARKKSISGEPVPDRNDEYFIYQTLAGTFPLSLDNYGQYLQRFREYVIKAVREAKVHTAWIKPDEEYEDKLLKFIDIILNPYEKNRFLKYFISFQERIAFYGMLNSLSQVILKTASPGIPDFYQGTELWDLNLVDPDNRRQVDYSRRREYMEYIKEHEKSDLNGLLSELWDTRADGRIKMFLVHRLLQARKNIKALFTDGEYIPLDTSGRYSDSIVAFLRINGDQTAIAIAPRFLTSVVPEGIMPAGEVWADTTVRLPKGFTAEMKDAVTSSEMIIQGEILLKKTMTNFPGMLLCGRII